MLVSVVIPFFQRSPGLLRKAVASILNQDLPPGVSVEVLVVDDASPVPADEDVKDLALGFTSLRIIRQPNGGPAVARNTGLNAVSQTSDFIAFLDSDDTWRPGHLETALAALGSDGDFYFCDSLILSNGQTWFAHHGFFPEREACCTPLPGDAGLYVFREGHAFNRMLEMYLSPTPTVVLRRATFGDLRFSEDLNAVSEDYFFWLSMAARKARVVFSSRQQVEIGAGVNVYASTLDWHHPMRLRTSLAQIVFWKKVRALAEQVATPAERTSVLKIVDGKLAGERDMVARVWLIQLFRKRRLDLSFAVSDPRSLAHVPLMAARHLLGRSGDGKGSHGS